MITTPIALTIAGSDPSAGAGIQADLKTFAARKVYGTSVIAALTAQNTLGVQEVQPVSADFVAAQLQSLLNDMPIAAIKTGMLYSAEIIDTIAVTLKQYSLRPLVVDPILISSSGKRLLDASATEQLLKQLLPLTTLLTPNLLEAAALLNTSVASTDAEIIEQAQALLEFGAGAVLLKGGHGEGVLSSDLLVLSPKVVGRGDDRQFVFNAPRLNINNNHGTGCTLSAAICAELAKGQSLIEAVASAKQYISAALARADEFKLGAGKGSLHHLHQFY